MNRFAMAVLVFLLTSVAHAGGNPDARIYVDFDPPNYVHEIAPQQYTTFDAYVCLDQISEGVDCVAFALCDLVEECPGVIATENWTILMNGDLPTCYYPWMWPGTLLCSDECRTADTEPVLLGYATYFYLGGSCCLQITENAEYPKWVIDCGDPQEIDEYCVLAHGSIGGGECPEGDCSPVPVEGVTWGTIKSLYR